MHAQLINRQAMPGVQQPLHETQWMHAISLAGCNTHAA